MLDPFEELILFLRLAQAYKARLQLPNRDKALVLAGTAAQVMQITTVAEFSRQLILQNNHGHMLRKYDSFAKAVQDPDFGVFLKQLRRKLSPEIAEAELVRLDYECEIQQSDYESEEAFAAAVMGVDAQWLREHFGEKD